MAQDNRTFVRWQISLAYRSNNKRPNGGTLPGCARLSEERQSGKSIQMTDIKGKKKVRPATQQRAPDRELELKVKKHPEDKDAKADLGSDESMDASDPSSATQPGSSEPAPSSGFPD